MLEKNNIQNIDKKEYEPLYSPGFHDISIDHIHKIFVNPFNDKEKREYLTNRFLDFIEKFSELEISAEIWIDGSYSTLKPEPDDIDILIVFNSDDVNSLADDKKYILKELFNRDLSKIRYSIDVLLSPSDDQDNRSYWRGWFGFSRSEQPKGIPRIYYGFN